MKQILFSLIALAALVVTSCNQGNKSNSQPGFSPGNFNPENMVNRQIERLDEAVELSDVQEKQVREIYMDNMMKMREEMQNSGGGFEGMREKMQQAREEQNVKIKEILSEEQLEKYLAYQEERWSRRGQGGPGGRPQ